MSKYEVWDPDDGNRVGEFDAKVDALAVVRDILAESGSGSVSPLALLRITDYEEPVRVLDGAGLIARGSRRFDQSRCDLSQAGLRDK